MGERCVEGGGESVLSIFERPCKIFTLDHWSCQIFLKFTIVPQLFS